MLDAEFAPFSDEDLALVGEDLLAFGGSGSVGDSSPFAIDDFLVPVSKAVASLPAAPAPVVVPMVPLAELHIKQSSSPHSSGDPRSPGRPPSTGTSESRDFHSATDVIIVSTGRTHGGTVFVCTLANVNTI
jgi:hypothetical protein